jgi:hypothetical protein
VDLPLLLYEFSDFTPILNITTFLQVWNELSSKFKPDFYILQKW